jgi:hypothetical protein
MPPTLRRGRMPVNENTRVRQAHRWLAAAFTLSVMANLLTLTLTNPPEWVAYLALLPLLLLFFTGLYLFVLPLGAKWRSGRPVL